MNRNFSLVHESVPVGYISFREGQMNISKKIISGLLGAISAGMFTSGVMAAPITIPVGLNPGDTYRLAFVTSTERNATSSDIVDYNAFVTAAANASPFLAALGTTWTAIASTQSTNARTNTNTDQGLGVAIYNLNGDKIASDNADLWDGFLLAPIVFDETGSLFQEVVYTGSDAAGNTGQYGGLGSASGNVTKALSPNTGPRWIDWDITQLADEKHFYGMSGLITVAAVPEPASLAVFGLGIVGLVCVRRRKAA